MDLTRTARQLAAATRNAIEVARFGGFDTGEEPSPFDVLARRPMFRLRRYFPAGPGGPPVVLIPPLMMSADVYDVAPQSSGVAILRELGADPWVVDFGDPEREEGGLRRTVVDHVLAVSEAVDLVRARTGRDVHLGGYSQGGMFAYQVAAFRRSAGIAGVITFGAPVDSRATRAFGVISEDLVVEAASLLADHVLPHLSVPAWVNRVGFRLLDPVKSTRGRIAFLRQLHDRDALLPRERQRQFLDNHGYVAYPGPAIADFAKQFLAHNRMLSGGFLIGDVTSTLADITCPVLAILGAVDTIAPPSSVRAIGRAAPRAEAFTAEVPSGHFGLVVGSGAARLSWPAAGGWIAWREGAGPRPEAVRELVDVEPPDGEPGDGAVHLAGAGIEAAGIALSVARSGARQAVDGVRAIGTLAGEARAALPRLARLSRVEPDTRISVGALLDERARRSPDDPFFVFAGRGHSYAAAKTRIDNVVRGLLWAGVRHGEHVGVLMETRPSALTVIAALNRIGAVGVLLRPDGATAVEATLGEVARIVADPEHAAAARRAADVPVLVLGGGGSPRALAAGATDLERVEPGVVRVPDWYRPNPGRAGDVAFLLFTGEGDGTRCARITNGRWALSAFGTATAAGLSGRDTVYSVTPLHHASGLLTGVGGAVAGGARLALATRADPATFWAEARRYGVTVVSYTWTLLRDLVEAEPDLAERGHPIRLFVGSGMPAWLWRRVRERFGPAGVLEFFASTDEGVVLANLRGDKIGAAGRPIPGSAEVAVVGYDPATGGLRHGPDGFAVRAEPGEAGLLVARAPRGRPAAGALRGLLGPDDAWRSTDHLFRRDADGDHWLVAHVADLVRTADGVVAPGPAEDAIGALDAVDLVAAYGVRPAATGPELLVAAVQLRPGRTIDAADLDAALGTLPGPERPALVRLVPAIPRSTWWRPVRSALRAQGTAVTGGGWARGATGAYSPAPRPPRPRRVRR